MPFRAVAYLCQAAADALGQGAVTTIGVTVKRSNQKQSVMPEVENNNLGHGVSGMLGNNCVIRLSTIRNGINQPAEEVKRGGRLLDDDRHLVEFFFLRD